MMEQKQSDFEKVAEREGKKQRMENMMIFINEQASEIEEHDENLVRRLIHKFIVYERGTWWNLSWGLKLRLNNKDMSAL